MPREKMKGKRFGDDQANTALKEPGRGQDEKSDQTIVDDFIGARRNLFFTEIRKTEFVA